MVNVHEARTHLSRLLEGVAAGEEAAIAEAGKPVARLLPEKRREKDKGARRPGVLPGGSPSATASTLPCWRTSSALSRGVRASPRYSRFYPVGGGRSKILWQSAPSALWRGRRDVLLCGERPKDRPKPGLGRLAVPEGPESFGARRNPGERLLLTLYEPPARARRTLTAGDPPRPLRPASRRSVSGGRAPDPHRRSPK